jgi:hypothetical protein
MNHPEGLIIHFKLKSQLKKFCEESLLYSSGNYILMLIFVKNFISFNPVERIYFTCRQTEPIPSNGRLKII